MQRVNLASLLVGDYDEALGFYIDKLGLSWMKTPP